MMTKKPRSTEGFSTLDDFHSEEGTREAFQAVAVKRAPLRELKLDQRRRFSTGELSDEEAERIASSRMDLRHDHLNKLLGRK
jgi:hypothetical protein